MAVYTDPPSSSATRAPSTKCQRCDTLMRSPVVCEACQALFPVHDANYFDLLGLPRRYAMDDARLREAFRAIARSVHPDRFGDDADDIKELATRLSADVNHAFQALSDPVRRAAYLLEMSGGHGAAESRDVPQAVLTDVMMIREEIEEARAAGDQAALDRHRGAIAQRREQTLGRIAEHAERLASSSDEQKKELRLLLNSMKYYDNLLAELAEDPLKSEAERSRGLKPAARTQDE